ncbi:MAG: damage-inducible protein DinB [Pedobacter sp.]|nr:MAG: damage-inducible protein DinB [Pedobacter sp.]
MKEEFSELFEYNNHTNQKLISLLSTEMYKVSEKTLQLLNHLINAHQIWNARIVNEKEFDVWQINDIKDLINIDNGNHLRTLKIIEISDLGNLIDYTNSKGLKFSSKVKDVLFHVINHSTYHRAQIATELKNRGIEPLNTDYIFYKRKQ